MNLQKHFGAIILFSVLLGFIFPGPGFLLKPYLQYILMLLMFVSCLSIRWKDIRNYLDAKSIFVMLLVIHVFTALVALAFIPFLSQELFLGLIIVAVTPSALSAVFLCDFCKGRPAEALTLTSISNLLSPITMPLLVLVFARTTIQVDTLSMFWLIVKLIIVPFALAQIINQLPAREAIGKAGRKVSIFILVAIIWAIMSPTREQIISNPYEAAFLFLITSIIVAADFFAGWLLGKSHEQAITYGITASFKNFTLATVIALTLFNPVVALPSVIYTISNNVLLAPMHYFFEWKKHHGKK